ncbi:MAG: HNH endonuclease [Colwellia sp.]|nr:HNH endonuclease [Colwellia sp.]
MVSIVEQMARSMEAHGLHDCANDLRSQKKSIYKRPIAKPKKTKKRKKKKNLPANNKSKSFYKSVEWRRLRYDALVKHGGSCLACGRSAKDGVIMNVDHIKPRAKYPELAMDLNNLQVLCGGCNQGKGNRDETDWR